MQLPTRLSSTSTLAATSATSRASTGASAAAAYGPRTTSPSPICAPHLPIVLGAKAVGLRLTQSIPLAMTASSTSRFRSPRKRDGCRAGSSSTLIVDKATTRPAPSASAAVSNEAAAVPTARGLTKTAVTPLHSLRQPPGSRRVVDH